MQVQWLHLLHWFLPELRMARIEIIARADFIVSNIFGKSTRSSLVQNLQQLLQIVSKSLKFFHLAAQYAFQFLYVPQPPPTINFWQSLTRESPHLLSQTHKHHRIPIQRAATCALQIKILFIVYQNKYLVHLNISYQIIQRGKMFLFSLQFHCLLFLFCELLVLISHPL